MTQLALHVERRGDASRPAVVLVQGLGMHSGAWAGVVPRLVDDFEVVLVDNRDVGRSPRAQAAYSLDDMADDLAAALDRAGLDRPVGAVGQSMGSAIALTMAARHPGVCSAVVAVAPAVRADEFLRTTLRAFSEASGSGTDRGTLGAIVMALSLARETYERNPGLIATAVEAFRSEALPQEPAAYGRQLDAFLSSDLSRCLPDVAIPVRVVVGSEDRLTPAGHARAVSEALPNSELIVLQGVGHALATEAPFAYVDLVRGHLLRHLHMEAE